MRGAVRPEAMPTIAACWVSEDVVEGTVCGSDVHTAIWDARLRRSGCAVLCVLMGLSKKDVVEASRFHGTVGSGHRRLGKAEAGCEQ